MWTQAEVACRSGVHLTDLVGSLLLAHADAAQRLHFLSGRLLLGAAASYLRSQALRREDVLYAADRAELDSRFSLMLEAGAEGCTTILRALIDDIGAAQVRCLMGIMSPDAVIPPSLQLGVSTTSQLPMEIFRGERVRLSARG